MFIPKYSPVHFLGYVDESEMIGEVVVFNTQCWGYYEGYVYASSIHLEPPTERVETDVFTNYELSPNFPSGKPSIVGFYCNWGGLSRTRCPFIFDFISNFAPKV